MNLEEKRERPIHLYLFHLQNESQDNRGLDLIPFLNNNDSHLERFYLLMVTLVDLDSGGQARVMGFVKDANKVYRHRLLAMGLTRGTVLTFIRKAPLGDPIEVEVRGFHLALRKQEAQMIEIEPLKD